MARRPTAGEAAEPSSNTGSWEPWQETAKDSTETDRSVFSAHVLGALEGSVTISPGTDLTAPLEVEWEAEQ